MEYNFKLPHVKYLWTADYVTSRKIYLKENHSAFKQGEFYTLTQVLYSETEKEERKKIWIYDYDNGKRIHVDINDFGDESDLRELKIKKLYE